jgi:uncharacterized SAM-binding protein YcdF (DUF218 family)
MSLFTLVKALVLPPGLQALIGLAGLLLYRRAPRLALTVIALTVASIWILAMPAAAGWIAGPLETHPPFRQAELRERPAEAIVVLGGGAYQDAPEFNGQDEVSRITLERLRYGARLHRATGIPLAVTGGTPVAGEVSEGALMQTVLETDFGVPVRWVESASRNTAENARMSRAAFPFQRIILVTHAVHMPRALEAFTDAGFEVIPAPTGFISRTGGGGEAIDYLPGMQALRATHYAIYEWFAILWYRASYD